MCGSCNTHNFASRAACFRCGATKGPEAGGGGAPVIAGGAPTAPAGAAAAGPPPMQ